MSEVFSCLKIVARVSSSRKFKPSDAFNNFFFQYFFYYFRSQHSLYNEEKEEYITYNVTQNILLYTNIVANQM